MNSRSGYSIMEVLIAFAVMSMTLAVLLPGQMQLLGRAGTAAERALAQDFAVSRIEYARVLGVADPVEQYGDWRIEQAVNEEAGARRVTVRVLRANGQTLAELSRVFGVNDAQ